MTVRIHPTADVAKSAVIGANTTIWNNAQIRENARLGSHCIVGKNAYIDAAVVIGNNVKIQNNVSIFQGVTIEDGVFVGPHVCFTNDLQPRAVNPDGSIKSSRDWTITTSLVGRGASIGANSTIVCGVRIGIWAMVGAGSVVTRDVPDFGLVYGSPARCMGFVCPCGTKLDISAEGSGGCKNCGAKIDGALSRAQMD
jgi:acetyltransferase-like isoleucine patch superfamily enzyme